MFTPLQFGQAPCSVQHLASEAAPFTTVTSLLFFMLLLFHVVECCHGLLSPALLQFCDCVHGLLCSSSLISRFDVPSVFLILFHCCGFSPWVHAAHSCSPFCFSCFFFSLVILRAVCSRQAGVCSAACCVLAGTLGCKNWGSEMRENAICLVIWEESVRNKPMNPLLDGSKSAKMQKCSP